MKNKTIFVILTTLLLMVIGVIFFNSALKNNISHIVSHYVADTLKPIIEKHIDTQGINLDYYIRKCAHIIEFFLLSTVLYSLFLHIEKHFLKALGLSIISLVLVASTDELIQSFSDRSSKFSDILLDLSGGITGIAISLAISVLIGFVKRKLKNNRLKNN